MKQEILDLIRSRPNIRTVEIADKLDMDPDTVRPKIADHIAKGEIVEEPIRAPNGQLVQSFRFADAQSQSLALAEPANPVIPARVARALPPMQRPPMPAPVKLAPSSAPALTPAEACGQDAKPSPSASETPTDVPVFLQGDHSAAAPAIGKRPDGLTRYSMAIARMHELHPEPLSNAQVIEAMGLRTTHSPYNYLRAALASGRVVYEGRRWRLGPVELLRHGVAQEVAEPGDADGTSGSASAAAQDEGSTLQHLPSIMGGLPILTHFGRSLLTTSVSSENGGFRPSVSEVFESGVSGHAYAAEKAGNGSGEKRDSAAERFLAGVMSDGSLHLRVPGQGPLDLAPEHARALWEFMSRYGYAAWNATA